jgi:hypothetical protein
LLFEETNDCDLGRMLSLLRLLPHVPCLAPPQLDNNIL